jgi:DNA primase
MNFAEQLKGQLNIVDVVGQYVRLKHQGTGPRYVGLCPFHVEKTPSFGVHSLLGYYKCFGCDAAGDVFKFVQEIESLTFPETLKLLAERYGIPMPERQRGDDPETQQYSALLEMHEMAADTFQNNLRNKGGAEARSYLESRGVSRASMDEFRLGLAETAGQQLAERLKKFGAALLEESGLVKKRDSGGFYDFFRARLMFPIHNESGKIIGFGGRALRAEDQPKYLNSPETKLYKKSTVLYNLHRAKIDARKNDRMILVEGYMDVIGVYAAGIHEVVAASGSKVSNEQVRTIKRQVSQQQANAGQVILNFDPDGAGAQSTEKYITPFLAEGLRVKVLEIPGGLDPDEYIQQNGADAYNNLLNGAASYFHWLAERARSKFDMRTAEGRADAFKYLWPAIRQVGDKVERSAIANEAAEYLNVDREVIRQQFRRTPSAEPVHKPLDITSALGANEKILIACLLVSEDARKAITHYLRQCDLIPLFELKPVFEALLRLDSASMEFSLEALAAGLEPRIQKILNALAFSSDAVTEENALQLTLQRLRQFEFKAKEAECATLAKQIRDLERQGDLNGALRLNSQLNTLKRRN